MLGSINQFEKFVCNSSWATDQYHSGSYCYWFLNNGLVKPLPRSRP